MKSKLTILAAVFLLAALAMPQLAEAQGGSPSGTRHSDKLSCKRQQPVASQGVLTYDWQLTHLRLHQREPLGT